MKIGQITQFLSSVKTNTIASTQPYMRTMPLAVPAYDTFEFHNSPEKQITKNVLSRFHKFNIKDYKSLSQDKIKAIKTDLNEDASLKIAVKDNLKMAFTLKPYLDKKYGKDNYVFVSIGRSPCGIARVFEFMGTETKYLPISGLRNYPDYDCLIGGSKGFEEYRNFLRKQGISNKEI